MSQQKTFLRDVLSDPHVFNELSPLVLQIGIRLGETRSWSQFQAAGDSNPEPRAEPAINFFNYENKNKRSAAGLRVLRLATAVWPQTPQVVWVRFASCPQSQD